MKRIYPLEDRCINCHLCEVACVVEHSSTRTPLGAYFLESLVFNPLYGGDFLDPAEALGAGRPQPLNRCLVSENSHVSLSTTCRHCEEPECVLACKNGSLAKGEDGRVVVDETRCVGCWMCLMACPYGAITRNPLVRNVPDQPRNGINHHCDLCPERDVPACVMICPTQALVIEDRDSGLGIRNSGFGT